MWVYIFIGVACGAIVCYFILAPKLKATQQIDKEIELLNRDTKNEIAQLKLRKDELIASIDLIASQTDEKHQQQISLLEERFSNLAEDLGVRYQRTEQEYQKEYLELLNENAKYFTNNLNEKRLELANIKAQLEDTKSKVNASIQSFKRLQADKAQKDFYRLNLSEIDIQEINKLREVEPYLRDSRPLNKVIWSVYYEQPYSGLVGRVLGKDVHTGIYKLTNTTNNMCYVGQAVNVADRWKTHIKCGLGADTGSNNKLYAAMKEVGPEAFMFELLEDCQREKLNEREQYWQEFFKAKEFGYSIR